MVEAHKYPAASVNIGLVGKYTDFADSYKSLNEALIHAGIQTKTQVNIIYIDSEKLEQEGVDSLKQIDAILVPGGFGERGIEGKILAAKYAREFKVPYLGICLGLQVAVIECARNMAELSNAHSSEFNSSCEHPVIALVSEWQDREKGTQQRTEKGDMGGTMRLGGQICKLEQNSLAAKLYGKIKILERHRHRYEVNNNYLEILSQAGLFISGRSEDDKLVEMIELSNHPWFIGCQFHPEFTSTPRSGHPLFTGFINAALKLKKRINSDGLILNN